jgi:hypothetical protein
MGMLVAGSRPTSIFFFSASSVVADRTRNITACGFLGPTGGNWSQTSGLFSQNGVRHSAQKYSGPATNRWFPIVVVLFRSIGSDNIAGVRILAI